MDFGKAFTFMFDDPEWLRKLGIGTLVGFLGIILSPTIIAPLLALFITLGYSLDVVRNVMRGKAYPLPDWQEWGGFLGRGFKLTAAFFLWSLPAILVMVPVSMGAAMIDERAAAGLQAIGSMLVACGSCLVILWALFLALLSPAIYARLATTDRFASAFELGRLWAFTRGNLGNVIIAILLVWVAGLVASIVVPLGLILVLIGILLTAPLATLWQVLVQAHLFGQIAATSVTPIEQ